MWLVGRLDKLYYHIYGLVQYLFCSCVFTFLYMLQLAAPESCSCMPKKYYCTTAANSGDRANEPYHMASRQVWRRPSVPARRRHSAVDPLAARNYWVQGAHIFVGAVGISQRWYHDRVGCYTW